MPLPFILAPLAVPVVVAKKRDNKRKQAASNVFSNKYPLLDDFKSMEASLAAALLELKNIRNSAANTASAQRVKSRNTTALNKWIQIIKGHLNDLKSGMNVASSESVVVGTAQQPAEQLPRPNRIPSSEVVSMGSAAPVGAVEESSVLAESGIASTRKKGINLLVLGGVAVGVFLIYKLLKK